MRRSLQAFDGLDGGGGRYHGMIGILAMLVDWATTDVVAFHYRHREGGGGRRRETRRRDEEDIVRNRSRRYSSSWHIYYKILGFLFAAGLLLLLLSPSSQMTTTIFSTTPTSRTETENSTSTNFQVDQRRHPNPRHYEIVLYPQDPDVVVETILKCWDQPSNRCHLMYHHLPKTGGTYIASKLNPMFENASRYRSGEWCCHDVLMDKFYNNTHDYCYQKRIGIYEVWGDEYYEVLEACRTLYPQELYVGLISLREPIQRTLSLIHQQCNSGYHKKNSLYQEYCRNCTYTDDTTSAARFWDSTFVQNTNRQYLSTLDFIRQQQQRNDRDSAADHEATRSSSTTTIPLLYVDSSMINDFFTRLSHGMRLRNSSLLDDAREIVNVENRSICDFGIKSSMIKKLQPSIDAYATIWQQRWNSY